MWERQRDRFSEKKKLLKCWNQNDSLGEILALRTELEPYI